jgi:hypothetical protein
MLTSNVDLKCLSDMLYNRFIEIRFPEKKIVKVPPRKRAPGTPSALDADGTIIVDAPKKIEKLLRQRAIGGRAELVNNRVLLPPSISIDVNISNSSDPNDAKVTIYNLSPQTQRDLLTEGAAIEIWAGYWPGNGPEEYAQIFSGQIRKAQTRPEGADSLTEIECGDGDDAIAHARVRKRMGETTHKEITQAILEAFKEFGVKAGRIDVPDFTESRPRTIDRSARREMDDICRQHDLQWSIQENVLNVYPRNEPLDVKEREMILSPESGVIESPQFSDDGLELKTLMLPWLRPGQTFRLENKALIEARTPESFKIEEINFAGDNFGGEFGCSIKAKQLSAKNKDKKKASGKTAKRKVKRSRQRFTGLKT